jgi:hypothetical protein
VNDEVRTFQIEFSETANELQKFCFLTRAKELQLDACDKLEILKAKASQIKKEAINSRYEDSANAMLSFEEMIVALISELKMWIALKDDNADAAWNHLVSAQYAARTAMQVHSVANHLDGYVNHLHVLEHVLFPPQGFLSPGMIIERSTCSICGRDYEECDHIVGEAYMGEVCVRIIEEVKELTEVSLVTEAANKRARIIRISDEEGILRDVMTWQPVSDNRKDNPD